MRFAWDEKKNRTNIRQHGIDFNDAVEIFEHPMLTAVDDREDYGEVRWIGVGLIHPGVAVVVYTERLDDMIRIISARKATKHETKRYEKAIQN